MMGTKTKKKPSKPKKTAKKKAPKKKMPKKTVLLIILIAAVLALAGIVIAAVMLSGRSRTPGTVIRLNKEVAAGIDVSSHNGEIDWDTVRDEVDFAFIRVGYRGYSEGEINRDRRAAYNLRHANRSGVPVGVYFYSQAVSEAEAEEEAAFVLSQIGKYEISLPVVIDFEYASKGGKLLGRLFEARLTKNEQTALINAFCDKIRAAGYTPGIYASSYIYRSYLNMKRFDDDIFIWVADYNEQVTYDGYYDIWQYTEKGKCAGVSSDAVDRNRWYVKNRFQSEGS